MLRNSAALARAGKAMALPETSVTVMPRTPAAVRASRTSSGCPSASVSSAAKARRSASPTAVGASTALGSRWELKSSTAR